VNSVPTATPTSHPARAQTRCRICGQIRPSTPRPGTYVVQRQSWVKIGGTQHISARLRALRSASSARLIEPEGMDHGAPLVLLTYTMQRYEHDAHERYAAFHAAGEWFAAAPVVAGLSWFA